MPNKKIVSLFSKFQAVDYINAAFPIQRLVRSLWVMTMRFSPYFQITLKISLKKLASEKHSLKNYLADQRNKTARKKGVNVCLWKSSAMCFIPCKFMMINRHWIVVRKCWGWNTYLLPSLGASICPEAFWESSDNTVKAAWAHAAATLGPTAQARKETWWNFPTVRFAEVKWSEKANNICLR